MEQKQTEPIKIKNEHYFCEVSTPISFFKCPRCYAPLITIYGKYCPSCGVQIDTSGIYKKYKDF